MENRMSDQRDIEELNRLYNSSGRMLPPGVTLQTDDAGEFVPFAIYEDKCDGYEERIARLRWAVFLLSGAVFAVALALAAVLFLWIGGAR